MPLKTILLTMIMGSMTIGFAVQADPWEDDSDYRYHEDRHHDRHYDKHHKKHHHKRMRRRDYDEVDYREHEGRRGPPPWAPAHGYRRHRRYNDETTRVIVQVPVHEERRIVERRYYVEPQAPQYEVRPAVPEVDFEMASQQIGISSGTCDREAVGAVMGGIVGGVIGNRTSSGNNKAVGTIAGALIGVVLGKELGRNMDKADAQCTSQVLERAHDGQAVVWGNPANGHRYAVTPYRTFRQTDGRYCRSYKTTITSGRNKNVYTETACRSDAGVWVRRR